ncbi:MAG: hypothetical protein ACLPVW_15350 [Terriglobales bacterium]
MVTNLWEWTPKRLLEWHRGKAGSIEAVHDVIKNESAGGVMPCGCFGAYAAWLRLAVLTYNVLTALQRLALPPELLIARPKRLRLSHLPHAGKTGPPRAPHALAAGAELEPFFQLAVRFALVAFTRTLLIREVETIFASFPSIAGNPRVRAAETVALRRRITSSHPGPLSSLLSPVSKSSLRFRCRDRLRTDYGVLRRWPWLRRRAALDRRVTIIDSCM